MNCFSSLDSSVPESIPRLMEAGFSQCKTDLNTRASYVAVLLMNSRESDSHFKQHSCPKSQTFLSLTEAAISYLLYGREATRNSHDLRQRTELLVRPKRYRSWKIFPVCETGQRCKYEFAVQEEDSSAYARADVQPGPSGKSPSPLFALCCSSVLP